MSRRRLAAALTVSVVLLAAVPAAAHDLTPEKTRIKDLSVAENASRVDVTGSATFGGQKLLRLGTDMAGDAAHGIRELDLVEAKLGQLDPANGDLNFIFKLADLPLVGGIPEAAEYRWDFRLAPLDRPFFSVETRFTNITGLGAQVPWAALRTCTVGPGVGCTRTPVVAEFVGSDNEIFVDVPWKVLETAAGGSLAGLRVAPAPGWGELQTSLAASQADVLAGWSDYSVAFPKVDVAIAPAGGDPVLTTPGRVENGGFTASLDTTGLPTGPYDVSATACYGTNCDTWYARVVL